MPAAGGSLPRVTDAQIVAAMTAADGNRTLAAKKLRCDYTTICDRIRASGELQKVEWDIRDRSIDLSESVVKRHLRQGKLEAARIVFQFQGHRRGLTSTNKTEISGGLTLNSINDLNDEQLDALILRIDRRLAEAQGAPRPA
jgi:hypothetical protein